MAQQKRAVVTGIGCINAVAKNSKEFLEALKQGVQGIRPITIFDTTDYRMSYAAQIDDTVFSEVKKNIDPQNNNSRINILALWAVNEALENSRINLNLLQPGRIGLCVGTSLGGIDSIDEYLTKQHGGANPDIGLYLDNCASMTGNIAMKYKITGPMNVVSTACAASTNAAGFALDLIRDDMADLVIAGGVDPISRISVNGFNALKSLSFTNCVRSFSNERDGLVIGEGAAFIILEEYEHAKARGATILAEIKGYAIANDAYHMTSPEPSGSGAEKCMRFCIEDAGLTSNDIDYVNAHGTGTKFNDEMELKAMQRLFGDRVKDVAVSSIKGMIGHNLGAAGSQELIASILSVYYGFIPPTVNFISPIPKFEHINVVPNKSCDKELTYVLSNSYAFAGNTASIAVAKYK